MTKKLTLSNDKKIAGVCGGFAEYFNVDPTIVRLIWLIMVVCCGIGLFAYLISWVIMPSPDSAQ